MTFLATTFRDLANDPSWPWDRDYNSAYSGYSFYSKEEKLFELVKFKDGDIADFIVQSPLTMARLALMVVEKTERPGIDVESILASEGINPADYANVRKRVEETK